jgi:hypothetical protein
VLKISKWFAVCALVLSIGGHWAVLQSVAWVGMTFNFSQDCSFQEALTKTFDGKHPCPLCKLVRAGKKSEAKEEAKMDLKKVDWFSDCILAYEFPSPVRESISPIFRPLSRAEAPPLPPPRSFLG